jgi:hypothetical protein
MSITKYDSLSIYFKKQNYFGYGNQFPLIYKSDAINNYSIEVSKSLLNLHTQEIIIKNPLDSTNYPICYSVVIENTLISLFNNESFVCHSIPTMKRNISLENKLNIKKFQHHWVLDNKLVGFSEGKYYYLALDTSWLDYSSKMPLTNQPKLFEDDTYIAFCDCQGEFGGSVYFYNKLNNLIYYAKAVCANSILKKGTHYFVLSHLSGQSTLKEIFNPNNLPKIELENAQNFWREGYSNTTTLTKIHFDFRYISVLSSFIYKKKTIYLINWFEETFLAELENNVFKLIHPLFYKEIHTDNSMTSTNGNITLINLGFYGSAGAKETSCLLMTDYQIIKINWNKKQN